MLAMAALLGHLTDTYTYRADVVLFIDAHSQSQMEMRVASMCLVKIFRRRPISISEITCLGHVRVCAQLVDSRVTHWTRNLVTSREYFGFAPSVVESSRLCGSTDTIVYIVAGTGALTSNFRCENFRGFRRHEWRKFGCDSSNKCAIAWARWIRNHHTGRWAHATSTSEFGLGRGGFECCRFWNGCIRKRWNAVPDMLEQWYNIASNGIAMSVQRFDCERACDVPWAMAVSEGWQSVRFVLIRI